MSNPNVAQTSHSALKTLEGRSGYLPSALSAIFGSAESAEQWQNYEQQVTWCLRIGDDKSAHGILERLVARFGASNERVMALRGLYQEAVADSRDDLETVLKEYEAILEGNPANLQIAKRRAIVLKSLSRPEQAIECLVELLRICPTDAESWCELSDLYLSQGFYSQAVFCLEEALLTFPNAWNLHAKLGEILYMSATVDSHSGKAAIETNMVNSIRRFARSIELCEGYLRGYYGLALATEKYISTLGSAKSSGAEAALSLDQVQSLRNKATEELARIIRDKESSYDEAELDAARKLLTAAA